MARPYSLDLRERVVAAVHGEVVLELERLVPQLVVVGERLEPERGVRRAAFVNLHEREDAAVGNAALVLIGVARLERVRHA